MGSTRDNQLKVKAWNINKPLPTTLEPNTIYYRKINDNSFDIKVVDASRNYLSLDTSVVKDYEVQITADTNSITTNPITVLSEVMEMITGLLHN